MRLELKVAQALIAKRKTISIAESCTGGLLSHRLTNISGSSKYFKLGLITYSNQAKATLLKINTKTLKHYGAVSQEIATAMAKSVRRIQSSDFGVSITGIAGPTGATAAKPVGLVYIAVASRHSCICLKHHFTGQRTYIKMQATNKALGLLLKLLK